LCFPQTQEKTKEIIEGKEEHKKKKKEEKNLPFIDTNICLAAS